MSEIMEHHGALKFYIDALLGMDSQPERDARLPFPSEVARDHRYLLFTVAGLQLALPLASLSGVRNMHCATGTVECHGTELSQATIHVIDTQAKIFAGSARARREQGYSYALMLEGEQWGLGCDGVGAVIDLTPEQVQWRGEHGRRPWLAGTLKEHACALLDVDACLRLWAPN